VLRGAARGPRAGPRRRRRAGLSALGAPLARSRPAARRGRAQPARMTGNHCVARRARRGCQSASAPRERPLLREVRAWCVYCWAAE
jgi:hypothetical protein